MVINSIMKCDPYFPSKSTIYELNESYAVCHLYNDYLIVAKYLFHK